MSVIVCRQKKPEKLGRLFQIKRNRRLFAGNIYRMKESEGTKKQKNKLYYNYF